MIKTETLFLLAKKVEEAIATLYTDMSEHMVAGSDEEKFFKDMAHAEHIHSKWVDDMVAVTNPEYRIETLSKEDFLPMLEMVEAVHDEVLNSEIKLHDALEIITHLEDSTAEEFYKKIPTDSPELPSKLIKTMVSSCEKHADDVKKFQIKHSDKVISK